MGTLDIILGGLLAVFAGINIFQYLNFRAYKKKYQKLAEKETAEAEESKQSALERRLEAMEHLYNKQGETIDELHKEVLTLKTERHAADRRMVELEAENKSLKDEVQTYKLKVDSLEKEVQAYRTIMKKEQK